MDTTATDPAQSVRNAAEAVREFNHLTFPRADQTPALPYPGDAYDAISALKTLAQRLPQAIEQIGTALDVLTAAGHLGASDGEDPQRHVANVQGFLITAMEQAGGLAQCLDLAHSAVSPLTYSGPDDGPEDEACGEGMCQCSCVGVLHACGCDCPRCPYCQQDPENCDCDDQ
ncbi:hypothetical protein AB0O67_23005 [Streptomyces sp. NPDC086077]|uniref:hypothetical protein n=1 Tax=Streptomyces sp. NPDC086077 TaxID=3154862 RepID=UPI0034315B80